MGIGLGKLDKKTFCAAVFGPPDTGGEATAVRKGYPEVRFFGDVERGVLMRCHGPTLGRVRFVVNCCVAAMLPARQVVSSGKRVI